MKKTIAVMILLAASVAASAEVAIFTGRSERVRTISGKDAINCQYQLSDRRTFWRLFADTYSCPATVNVQ